MQENEAFQLFSLFKETEERTEKEKEKRRRMKEEMKNEISFIGK
jgi:hypothetical protein